MLNPRSARTWTAPPRAEALLPAYIGPRGWFGLRLDGPGWTEVWELVAASYRLVAPKTLAKWLDGA